MFRKAALADLAAISSIYDAIHDMEEGGRLTTGWQRHIYPTGQTAQAAIKAGDMFVMERDGRIVAAARINQIQGKEYAQAHWSCDVPEQQVMVLHTLVVSPDAFGKGCATQFVSFYETYAAQQGCTHLRMDTNQRNLPARALYKKLGYREVSVVPCTFNGIEGVQLVCLEKAL